MSFFNERDDNQKSNPYFHNDNRSRMDRYLETSTKSKNNKFRMPMEQPNTNHSQRDHSMFSNNNTSAMGNHTGFQPSMNNSFSNNFKNSNFGTNSTFQSQQRPENEFFQQPNKPSNSFQFHTNNNNQQQN